MAPLIGPTVDDHAPVNAIGTSLFRPGRANRNGTLAVDARAPWLYQGYTYATIILVL